MRTVAVVCGVVLGVLSLDCGGTFCDEYPEACAPIGGGNAAGAPATGAGGVGGDAPGGAGTGGEGGQVPVGPFDVTVSLVDLEGDHAPLVPVLVTDSEGSLLQETETGANGLTTVSVPDHGRVWLFLELDSVARVYSAEVVEGVSEIAFLLRETPPAPNPNESFTLSFYCADCGTNNELSMSCERPTVIADAGPLHSTSVSGFNGCPGTNAVEATVVSYDAGGKAFRMTRDTGALTDTPIFNVPEAMPVAPNERFDFDMAVTGAFNFDIEFDVQVPNASGGGYGYSRHAEGTAASHTFSLVTELVPTFEARTMVWLSATRFLARLETFSGVSADTAVSLDVEALALPAVPAPIDFARPAQPAVSFSLGDGPLGDAVIVGIADAGDRVWTLAVPPGASGTIRLPELPASLAVYALAAGSVTVAHGDVDAINGYVEWVSGAPDSAFIGGDDSVDVTATYAF